MTDIFRSLGRADALKLREEAHSLSGTQIIDREHSAPAFDPQKDYSAWPAGAPVTDEGQVWLLIQPHNASNYAGRPSALRALWGLAHTTDPKKAKPWVDAHGTSGIYMAGECYRDADGVVWRCLQDNTIHAAGAAPERWESVEE
ncbi:MAG: hypothetical protein IKJ11_04910 [Clostridia bacterium]|nr:hypothetical protein [Clostridia bacterium]